MKKQILILTVFLFLCLLTFSQPNPGGNPADDGQTPIGSGVPLDGGLIALFVAGAAYGTKKLYKKRNDKK